MDASPAQTALKSGPKIGSEKTSFVIPVAPSIEPARYESHAVALCSFDRDEDY